MKRLEDYLNSRSTKLEVSDIIDIKDSKYNNVINFIAQKYNLEFIEKKMKSMSINTKVRIIKK